jgi:hypothetical protein
MNASEEASGIIHTVYETNAHVLQLPWITFRMG